MKKLAIVVLASFTLFSCQQKENSGQFKVIGEIRNAPDQKVYLDELSYSKKDPEVVDTAEMKNGKFELKAVAPEQGMFRIRLENQSQGYLFINDEPEIEFSANANDLSIDGPVFSTPANSSLKQFLIHINTTSNELRNISIQIDSLQARAGNDSLTMALSNQAEKKQKDFELYISKLADTTTSPVLAMFALGYVQNMNPEELSGVIKNLSKRFPNHQGITSMALQYNQLLSEMKQREEMKSKFPDVGSMAPDFTLPDPTGKPVSLSSLKGKYVLVDFWASWCAPCRRENPNVVSTYNRFKNKNFTILGVSLDENKAAWEKAIMQDGLTWEHISDLKGWESVVVGLYGIEGIPYNILIDPQGKIIATSLRGPELPNKLQEILK